MVVTLGRTIISEIYGLIWTGAATLALRGATFLSLIGTSIALDSQTYGLLGLTLSAVVIVTQTVGYGFGLYALRATAQAQQSATFDARLFGFITSRAVLCSGVSGLYLAGGLLASGHADFTLLVSCIAYSILNCLYQIHLSILQGLGKWKSALQLIVWPISLLPVAATAMAQLGRVDLIYLVFSIVTGIATLRLHREVAFCCQVSDHPSREQVHQNRNRNGYAIAIASSALLAASTFYATYRLASLADLREVGTFTLGTQWRALLFLVPGIAGNYYSSGLAAEGRDDGFARTALLRRASYIIIAGVSVLAIVGCMAVSWLEYNGLDKYPGLSKVFILSSMSALFVGISTPMLRASSLLSGEWPQLAAALVVAGLLILTVIWLPVSSVAYTAAFTVAYSGQLIVSGIWYRWATQGIGR